MVLEIFQSFKSGQWYFRIRSSNGKVIAQSEGYHNKQDCIDTAMLIKHEIGKAEIRVPNGKGETEELVIEVELDEGH
jgi:uncharacterized protein YegP (UPF0339 family)